MGKDRQGRLLSYLALAWLVAGLLVHALPASAASPAQGWQGAAAFDIDSAGDQGILPYPLKPLELRGQRSPRASRDDGADSDTLSPAHACGVGLVGEASFFLFDSERCSRATRRLTHRPRDPPRRI